MGSILAFIILGLGWPALIYGSWTAWNKAANAAGPAKSLLGVALLSFYALGYAVTAHWLDLPWLVAALPAFAAFVALGYCTLQTADDMSRGIR